MCFITDLQPSPLSRPHSLLGVVQHIFNSNTLEAELCETQASLVYTRKLQDSLGDPVRKITYLIKYTLVFDVCLSVVMLMWRLDNNFRESVLSFYHRTLVIMFEWQVLLMLLL